MRHHDRGRETRKGPLVLIIEDDPGQREFITAVLSAKGYDVRCAETGKEGLDRAWSLEPALILLDIALPDTDGIAAYLSLRDDPRTSGIPVVTMTAFDQGAGRALQSASEGLGTRGHLQKPFSPDQLETCVSDALAARTNRTIRTSVGAISRRPSESALSFPGVTALRPLSHLETEGELYKRELSIGLIKIDGPSSGVSFAGRPVELSPNTLALLVYLMINAGRWIPWEELQRLKSSSKDEWTSNKESGALQFSLSDLKARFNHKIDGYFRVQRGYGIKFQAP